MAKMTGANFLTYVKEIYKRTDKDTELYEIITDVIQDIKLGYFFDEFQTESYSSSISTLGDFRLDLPSDFGHLMGDVVIQDDSGASYQLKKLSKDKFDRKYPYNDETDVTRGKPINFCKFGGQILFGPVPDSTSYIYQINYSTESATTVNSSTTEVDFTDKGRWGLRSLVLSEAFDLIELYEEGQLWRNKGNAWLEKLIASEQFDVQTAFSVEYNDL